MNNNGILRNTFWLIALLIAGASGCSKSPTMEEFTEVKQNLEKMQKDVDEIKKWVADHTPPKPKPFQPSPLSIISAPFVGKADAPLTLVEFTDYQCPFCKRHAVSTLPQIVKEYVDTGNLKYVLRDFPLQQIHPNAAKLAQAVLCANEQGKGWEMHNSIFNIDKSPDPNKLTKEIKALGIDAKGFDACLKADKYAGNIEESIKEGDRLGVTGTPAFFLGKTDLSNPDKILATEKIVGAQPFAVFKAAMDKLSGEKPEPEKGK